MKRFVQLAIAALTVSAIYLYAWPAANLFYAAAVLFHVGLGVAFCVAGLFLLRDALRAPVTRKAGLADSCRRIGPRSGAHLHRHLAHPLEFDVRAHCRERDCGGPACCLVLEPSPEFRRATCGQQPRAWWSLPSSFRSARFMREARGASASPSRTLPRRRCPWTSEGDGAQGPFFPSSAQVAGNRNIPGKYFMESDACERCHQDIYKQWQSSAHHFSSFNNQWYRKSIEYMQDVEGTHPSRWCGGCHDPAVLYSGMMDTPIKQIMDRPETQAGLGLHDVPLHRQGEEHHGPGRLRARLSQVARACRQQESRGSLAARFQRQAQSRAASPRVPQTFHARADAGVLLLVPQGAPRRAGEQLSLVPRIQRVRQLAGQWRIGIGCALVLLSAEAAGLPGLPHAAHGFA